MSYWMGHMVPSGLVVSAPRALDSAGDDHKQHDDHYLPLSLPAAFSEKLNVSSIVVSRDYARWHMHG